MGHVCSSGADDDRNDRVLLRVVISFDVWTTCRDAADERSECREASVWRSFSAYIDKRRALCEF